MKDIKRQVNQSKSPARTQLRRALGVHEPVDAVLVAAGRGRAVARHTLALLGRRLHVVVHVW